jgi:hypothetical protein
VLTDIGFRESQFVGQKEGFAIFPERELPILLQRMDRHGKKSQIHHLLLPGADFAALERCALDAIMTNPKVESSEIIVR